MPFAASLSEHPEAREATAEVVGHLLEALGPSPDLVVLFVTGPHVAKLPDIATAVQELLQPGAFIGTSAVSVLGGDREVEQQPAISLWGGRLGAVRAVRLDAVRTGDGMAILGIEPDQLDAAATLVLLADPSSFPVDDFVDAVARDHPHLAVIGGMASAGFGPGANGFVLDGVVHDDGAVGVLLDAGQIVSTVVSQGCRPIGEPLVVTRAERNVIQEIAGQPALRRLDDVFRSLSEEERGLVQNGLHIGRVIDEHKLDFTRGDFLVRNVVGADRETGSIAIGDVVEVGATIQFHVRDAASADEDLRELLTGHEADGALVFTCNGRGTRLFGEPDHDAELVARVVDGDGTAGMFCAGEIGPIGARSFMHGFTASIALFRDPT
jgi:small ligand-binding sensory domain FIST